VVGWPRKALIRTFLGRLKADISNDVCKFKSSTLHETIELAQMREDELIHSKMSPHADMLEYTPQTSWESNTTTAVSSKAPGSQPSIKKLSWEEMQKKKNGKMIMFQLH
jgi:hypothetical protein